MTLTERWGSDFELLVEREEVAEQWYLEEKLYTGRAPYRLCSTWYQRMADYACCVPLGTDAAHRIGGPRVLVAEDLLALHR
eukprot:2963567-Rhodomonas_salina.5